MAKKRNLLQQNIYNERARLRQRMVALARSHRGCEKARGCGCATDRAIAILEETEAKLFGLELESYASQDLHGGYPHYRQPELNAGSDAGVEKESA